MILFSVAFLAARCILSRSRSRSLRLLHSALAIHVIKIYAKNLLGKFLEHVTVHSPCTPAPLLSHTFHSTKVASREILSRTAQLAGEEDPPRNRIRHRNRNMAALHDMQGRRVHRVGEGGRVMSAGSTGREGNHLVIRRQYKYDSNERCVALLLALITRSPARELPPSPLPSLLPCQLLQTVACCLPLNL